MRRNRSGIRRDATNRRGVTRRTVSGAISVSNCLIVIGCLGFGGRTTIHQLPNGYRGSRIFGISTTSKRYHRAAGPRLTTEPDGSRKVVPLSGDKSGARPRKIRARTHTLAADVWTSQITFIARGNFDNSCNNASHAIEKESPELQPMITLFKPG